MLSQLLNWKTLLLLIAVGIATGTVFYSRYLANKIEVDERKKVEQWVEASKSLSSENIVTDIELASRIVIDNTDIPIIATNEADSIMAWVNIEIPSGKDSGTYIVHRWEQFKAKNKPIVYQDPLDSTKQNFYYYGNTDLLNDVIYYPYIQLIIVGLFIVITLFAVRSSYQSTQNQVWAGLAKETAHQLGTPVSSLEGWLEILKTNPDNEPIAEELSKDINRLRLVSDRFGKIGSSPVLDAGNIVHQIEEMVGYMRTRASGKVKFFLNSSQPVLEAPVNAPLFDWVIENLLKNALDAMEGEGTITVTIKTEKEKIVIDVADTGKGISRANINKVFNPGFTTKKRGWGLGLSLAKRIIEQYHKGKLFVLQSEPGKGTTFRIVLDNVTIQQ